MYRGACVKAAQVDLVKIKFMLIIPVTVGSSSCCYCCSLTRGLLVHCWAHAPSRMSPQLHLWKAT